MEDRHHLKPPSMPLNGAARETAISRLRGAIAEELCMEPASERERLSKDTAMIRFLTQHHWDVDAAAASFVALRRTLRLRRHSNGQLMEPDEPPKRRPRSIWFRLRCGQQ